MKWNTLIFISLQSCQQLFTMATKAKVPFVGGHFVLVNILLNTHPIQMTSHLILHVHVCLFIIRCFSTGGVTIHKVKVTLDKATVNN